MATGTAKWFDDAKGYGFVTPAEGGMNGAVAPLLAARRAGTRGRR